MNKRLKELHFPLTLDMDSWSDRVRITLTSSWEQKLEKNWRKTFSLLLDPQVWKGEKRWELFFLSVLDLWVWKRERASWVFFLWESQRRDKGAANKNKEGRKQRSKERKTKEVSGAAKKSRKMASVGHV